MIATTPLWPTHSARHSTQAKTIEFEETTLHLATPAEAINSDAAIIDIHGGAFVFGGGEACRVSARSQAESQGISCYGVDYHVPPDHPYPAALDDCMATYRYVLEHHEASRIAIIGWSAGGNLAAAMLLRAKAEGLRSCPSAWCIWVS
ncbi:alpha/beta hydrolase [Rhizobium tumorigenes]|uniref:Alpha/beta hydrolase fold domain-containing protein n=1 Tax=Rhizobium tumorigenes TaxID=2041385 RepID=A0AAF1K8S0_9HYPH|nr:alpha/beta hydrolase fold domain-containing protein [Rhizobium tumorigenes]WFR97880.1 alpha/beta hydrolase fold domain-containing protein [Rhizobium tumorigenes]